MEKFKKLNFGTAGVPITSPSRNLIEGIPHVKRLGLDSLELEFVQQVYVKTEQTKEIKKISEDNEVYLTCHGQYYINLNSKEPEKLVASQKRIYQAAKIADMCGAKFLTFHAGFYLGQDKEEVYKKIRDALEEVKEKLDSED
ncbi:TIM barrel protein, partial [Candidatus Woesearchaeota archaeon]|nr:TIM barrel protein [Candidatus Woesearchaeota archaeon]